MFVPAARVQAIRRVAQHPAAQRVRDLQRRRAHHPRPHRRRARLRHPRPRQGRRRSPRSDAGAHQVHARQRHPGAARRPSRPRCCAAPGRPTPATEIAVGGGAKQVIFLALMAAIDAGDEVIVPAPYWVSYPDMVLAHDGVPGGRPCPEADGFRLTPQALEAAITPRTRWVVLNAPGNPTGAALHAATSWPPSPRCSTDHPQVVVLCDEIYDEITFTDRPATSLVSVAPRLRRADPARQRGLQDLRDDGVAARLGRRRPRADRRGEHAAVAELVVPVLDQPGRGRGRADRRRGLRRRLAWPPTAGGAT